LLEFLGHGFIIFEEPWSLWKDNKSSKSSLIKVCT
jgi:hypothetical protein